MIEQAEPTNGYERMLRDITSDQSLSMETREAVSKSDLAADALTREYSRLHQDQDLTEEARRRRAEEAREHYAPRVKKERGRAKEALIKEAERLERASMPKPTGQSLSPPDTTSLIADQNEAQRIEKQLERLQSQKGPFKPDTADFLASEYKRGIETGGPEGGAICRGVLRVARERGIGDSWLTSLMSEEQLAKLDRARQLTSASWSIPLEASNIPRSLRGPRKLSRRPEQRRDFGPVLVPQGPVMTKTEDLSGTVGAPSKKAAQRDAAASRKRKR